MKNVQYSKLLVFFTGTLFLLSLIYCITRDISSVYDTSLYTAAITITGGVFGSAIIWYEKKAQAENVSKIQLQHIKDTAKIEFSMYEKKLRLQQELGILGEADSEADFSIEEQANEAVESDSSYLSEKLNDATSEPEIQTY